MSVEGGRSKLGLAIGAVGLGFGLACLVPAVLIGGLSAARRGAAAGAISWLIGGLAVLALIGAAAARRSRQQPCTGSTQLPGEVDPARESHLVDTAP